MCASPDTPTASQAGSPGPCTHALPPEGPAADVCAGLRVVCGIDVVQTRPNQAFVPKTCALSPCCIVDDERRSGHAEVAAERHRKPLWKGLRILMYRNHPTNPKAGLAQRPEHHQIRDSRVDFSAALGRSRDARVKRPHQWQVRRPPHQPDGVGMDARQAGSRRAEHHGHHDHHGEYGSRACGTLRHDLARGKDVLWARLHRTWLHMLLTDL